MPKRRTMKSGRRKKSRAVVKRRKRRQHGGSFLSSLRRFGGKANRWLKRTKAISRGAKVASMFGIPYAGTVGKAAGMAGYGKGKRRKRTVRRRRRRQRGGSISPSGGSLGGALMLAGAGRHRMSKNYRRRSLGIGY